MIILCCILAGSSICMITKITSLISSVLVIVSQPNSQGLFVLWYSMYTMKMSNLVLEVQLQFDFY